MNQDVWQPQAKLGDGEFRRSLTGEGLPDQRTIPKPFGLEAATQKGERRWKSRA